VTHGPRALRLSGSLHPCPALPCGEPCRRRSRPCHTQSPCVARAGSAPSCPTRTVRRPASPAPSPCSSRCPTLATSRQHAVSYPQLRCQMRRPGGHATVFDSDQPSGDRNRLCPRQLLRVPGREKLPPAWTDHPDLKQLALDAHHAIEKGPPEQADRRPSRWRRAERGRLRAGRNP
jgi:hypothetical protein